MLRIGRENGLVDLVLTIYTYACMYAQVEGGRISTGLRCSQPVLCTRRSVRLARSICSSKADSIEYPIPIHAIAVFPPSTRGLVSRNTRLLYSWMCIRLLEKRHHWPSQETSSCNALRKPPPSPPPSPIFSQLRTCSRSSK